MTQRSQRRAAELAVIEAARAVMGVTWDAISDDYWEVRLDLEGCLRELDALGLETPGRARANKGAPVTAQQAAIWMNGEKAKSVCARIVKRLSNFHWTGLTSEELQHQLQGKHQTISARINELRDNGWIVDSGSTRPTSSGREAIVWVLSHAARQAINGQESMVI